jgi:hypothetical protein
MNPRPRYAWQHNFSCRSYLRAIALLFALFPPLHGLTGPYLCHHQLAFLSMLTYFCYFITATYLENYAKARRQVLCCTPLRNIVSWIPLIVYIKVVNTNIVLNFIDSFLRLILWWLPAPLQYWCLNNSWYRLTSYRPTFYCLRTRLPSKLFFHYLCLVLLQAAGCTSSKLATRSISNLSIFLVKSVSQNFSWLLWSNMTLSNSLYFVGVARVILATH